MEEERGGHDCGDGGIPLRIYRTQAVSRNWLGRTGDPCPFRGSKAPSPEHSLPPPRLAVNMVVKSEICGGWIR